MRIFNDNIPIGLYVGDNSKIPFFYIIQHIPSTRFYAGCKYAKKHNKLTDWSTFMTAHGYKTSSKVINEFIKNEGLTSFKIVTIISEDKLFEVFNPNKISEIALYEDWFLDYFKCVSDPRWLNKARGGSIHTEKHRNMMQEKIPNSNITFAQMASLRGALTMRGSIRDNAAKTAALARKNDKTYGSYIICDPSGRLIICNGNFHKTCLTDLGMPKSVFQDLRDKGIILAKPKDRAISKTENINLCNKYMRSIIICAKARCQFNGWTCICIAEPHGQNKGAKNG